MKNNDSNILFQFAERVKSVRKAKGLSQESLADKAGLHRTYIGMVERAEKNITLKNIEKISIALEVGISELLNINNANR